MLKVIALATKAAETLGLDFQEAFSELGCQIHGLTLAEYSADEVSTLLKGDDDVTDSYSIPSESAAFEEIRSIQDQVITLFS